MHSWVVSLRLEGSFVVSSCVLLRPVILIYVSLTSAGLTVCDKCIATLVHYVITLPRNGFWHHQILLFSDCYHLTCMTLSYAATESDLYENLLLCM